MAKNQDKEDEAWVVAATNDTLSGERLVPALPGALADPTANAAVIPLIPLCPSLLYAAKLREGETLLGRSERGAVRDIARVGRQ